MNLVFGITLLAIFSQFNFVLPTTQTYEVFFTSYNPVTWQTDNSPCIGASLLDLCTMRREGERVLALSQDLVGRHGDKPFTYGDKVYLIPLDVDDSRCRGIFSVQDTMNKRYRMRGDLFFFERKDNISCRAKIFNLSR